MAILKCKMCGGDIELSADKTFGTCEYCGSTMTFPKVDDEQRAAMFNRGNHFRRTGEFDKALAVYERIVQEDEDDAEAHWCCALCRFGIEYVEDPNTFEYLPTCHRASFDSFLEDVDYLAALEHSDGITRRQYQKDAAKIAEVQRGILATSQNEEPFDVFLCYKETEDDGSRTRDSLYAQDIYYQLTEQGRRVFFSRITLEDKAGTEYEPYIFAALNSAKVMVLVTTSAEHANAVWVKNEWSRFLSLMRKDRTKLLLPCYRDMDPYDLPEALSVLQSYDMSKIGFIQDLIRGVNKVLNAAKPKPQAVKETVVVQQPANPAVTPLLKRAFLFLEDGDWQSADEYCEKVLDMDPENGEAYLGKLMTELHVRKREALRDQPQPFEDQSNYAKAMRFGSEQLKAELSGVTAYIQERNETARQKGVYQQAMAAMSERSEQGYRKAAELFASVPDYGDARAKVDECLENAETTRREGIYRQASALMGEDTEPSCRKAAELFAAIPDYADAAKQREKCLQRAETIRQDGIYQRALAAMKERSAQGYQRATALLSSIPDYKDARQKIADCAAAAEDLRQGQIYQKAADLARGDTEDGYEKAAELFASIPEHRDARDRSLKCREKAETIRKEQVYRNAVKLASYRSMAELEEAARLFGTVSGYKDADKQLFICQNKIQELLAKEEARRLKRQQKEQQDLAAAEHRKNRKPNRTPLVVGLIAVALIAVAVVVVLPGIRAKKEVDVEQPVPTEASNAAATAQSSKDESARVDPKAYFKSPLIIASGPSNGACAPLGDAFVKALGNHGYTAQNQRTGGTGENLQLMLNGTCELAMVQQDAALWAYTATGAYEGRHPAEDLRALMALFPNHIQLIARADVNIRSVEDLKGKRVGVGVQGSGVEMNVRDILDAYGFTYSDIEPQYVGSLEALDSIKSGQCDAVFLNSRCPNATVLELSMNWDTVVVPIDGKARNKLISEHPGYVEGVIPAGTYGNDGDVPTVTVWTILLVNKDLADEVVYDMLEGITQNLSILQSTDVGKNIDMSRGVDPLRLPLHSGAEAFWRDRGYASGILEGKFTQEFWDQHAARNTIAAGEKHSVAIKTNGNVVTVGLNDNDRASVASWKDMVSVATGRSQTVGLKADGTVIMVSSNGDDQRDLRNVEGWTDIVAIAAGKWHTVGLKNDGTVVSVGNNSYGQRNVSDWRDIIAVSAGTYNTAGIKTNGTVVVVGANSNGQCNVSEWTEIMAVAVGDSHTVGLKPDGTVVAVGSNRYGQCDVSAWTDIVTIAAGEFHTVGLKADGTVVAVGGNGYGECDVDGWADIVTIAAGSQHTVGLKADGTVVAVGRKDDGQCNVYAWTDIRVPEKQVQNVEYTSNLGDVAADLTIKSMTCRQEGDMLVFTIEYSATKNYNCSAFNPPNGTNFKVITKGATDPNKTSFTFSVKRSYVLKEKKMTIKFYISPKEAYGYLFINNTDQFK